MPTKILNMVSVLVYRNHHLLDNAETTTLFLSTSHFYCNLLHLQGGVQLWVRMLVLRYVCVGSTITR